MASPAARRVAHAFVAQVIDHLSPTLLTVWDLSEGCAYQAYPFPSDNFPVGSVVHCTMDDPDGFVDDMTLADDSIVAEFSRRLVTDLPKA